MLSIRNCLWFFGLDGHVRYELFVFCVLFVLRSLALMFAVLRFEIVHDICCGPIGTAQPCWHSSVRFVFSCSHGGPATHVFICCVDEEPLRRRGTPRFVSPIVPQAGWITLIQINSSSLLYTHNSFSSSTSFHCSIRFVLWQTS